MYTAESVNDLIWNVTCAQVLLCSRTFLMWRIFYSKKNWSVLNHSRTSSSSCEPIMSTTLKLRYDITSFVYMLLFLYRFPKVENNILNKRSFFSYHQSNDWLFWWQAGLDEYCDVTLISVNSYDELWLTLKIEHRWLVRLFDNYWVLSAT